jgi:pimeloyl-ACP methyl ester carboxylesterase
MDVPSQSFRPADRAFCENYHVVAVDLRGHGQSDRPQLEYKLELFAGDIAAVCSDLELEHPILVGHTMGESIALEGCDMLTRSLIRNRVDRYAVAACGQFAGST